MIAGAGKTVLTSTLLNELVLPRRQPDMIITYYYFDFREKGSQTPEALLGSILSQICTQLDAIPQAISKSFDHHTAPPNGQRRSADFDELEDLLLSTVLGQSFPTNFVLVIDALDECVDRSKILSTVNCLVRSAALPKSVQVFVTSRPEEDIITAFSGKPRIEIQDQSVSDDVHGYLDDAMTKMPRLKDLKPDLKATIVSFLTEKCDGM
jgi:hypothetical protein